MDSADQTVQRPRPSACAAASLQAEIERIGRMTVEERIKAALSMKTRFQWLQPVPRKPES